MRRLIFTASLALVAISVKAQEPGAQPTNLSFFNIKPYGFSLSFTPEQCDGFLILRSTSPISFTPQDGVEYQKGQGVAPGVKVFASSASSSASIKEVLEGTTYHFAIFSFNNSGSNIDYKNTNPLTGTINVPLSNPGNYYNSISGGSPTVLADLKTRLNTSRVFQSYTPGYINNLMNNFYLRDTVGGMLVSVCQYTGEVYIKNPPYTWWGTQGNPGQFSREHCLPRSWMPTGGNTSNQDGADYHNLIPVNQEKANARRSNHPYGIVQNITYQYLEGKLGTNSQGNTVYEPINSIKGDVARAQFYTMICYNGNGGTPWGYQNGLGAYAPQQSQELLKIWHMQDPPDEFERTRNEYIYSIQNNRNPFIDYPELADCINFNTMALYAGCNITLDIDENKVNKDQVLIFPNPVSVGENITIQTTETVSVNRIEMMDVNGRLVYSSGGNNNVSLTVPTSNFVGGLYFIRVLLSNGNITSYKVVINH